MIPRLMHPKCLSCRQYLTAVLTQNPTVLDVFGLHVVGQTELGAGDKVAVKAGKLPAAELCHLLLNQPIQLRKH